MPSKQKQNSKLQQLQNILTLCRKQLNLAQKIVSELDLMKEERKQEVIEAQSVIKTETSESQHQIFKVEKFPAVEEIIEGVFNGKEMIGPNGSPYYVPENYASKSKIVEGDLLKLTITPQGRFIYKQIGPVERETKRGILMGQDNEEGYYVRSDDFNYNVLKASVTYYKGEPGDQAVIIVPRKRTAIWAAIDHIINTIAQEVDNQDQNQIRSTGELEQI